MNQPNPITYTTEHKTVSVDHPSRLITMQGYPCIDGGWIKHKGKTVKYVIRYDNKPELNAEIEEWTAAWAKYEEWTASEFARNVPGLDDLRKAQDEAHNDRSRYADEFERMMEDEGNDGARPPRPIDESAKDRVARLAAEYPRAAAYLRAKDYTLAGNDRKYAAGKKAMEIIATGGTIEEANDVMANWLPEESKWA